MTGHLKLHLKANERIFINGGVVKVDRKVAIELMNDMVFLLENHVMQQEQATTPLRQLYFIIQWMLVDPKSMTLARRAYVEAHQRLIATFKNQDILEGLVKVRELIENDRAFEALKCVRLLFETEDRLRGTVSKDMVAVKAVP